VLTWDGQLTNYIANLKAEETVNARGPVCTLGAYLWQVMRQWFSQNDTLAGK